MNTAYLSLGSNLGDRKKNLLEISRLLSNCPIEIIQSSSIYETSPWGVKDAQPNYYNQVLKIYTSLYPFGLMNILQSIEVKMGRIEKGNLQARTADIDIILFNDWRIYSDTLQIPHPRFKERFFVLKPLMEIAADVHDPESLLTISELYSNCKDILEIQIVS
ncbi:MAG: 2-amino-4-hydroxy-6-hydroxymethyldihydropteridine diphosphokinase [Chitinophagales bacterium]|nr:2-amino-4-hydroxy-6-hydroxymethyldihydropteridine diphosphokinase [Chitinophagales bacterium]MCZ2394379.1 2-amino-4-hydroxy-6-hydroxymethyldihydropteridine diphosphokinase [Chitinophagales bacterium]